MAGWFGFLAYYVGHQPTGITAGDNVDTYIIWAIAIIAVAIPIITIMRIRGRETSGSIGSVEGDTLRPKRTRTPKLSEMSTDEYKASIHSIMKRR
jgi:hypothetical protein